MLFRCEYCAREVESGEPKVLPQGIALICPVCGALNWLSTSAPVVEQPNGREKKAGAASIADELTTPRENIAGGFVFVSEKKAGAGVEKKAKSLAPPALPSSLSNPTLEPALKRAKVMWANLLTENYDDQTAHKKFLEFCSSTDILDVAAYEYRKKMYEEGEDPMSMWALDYIIGLATARYLVPSAPEKEKKLLSPSARKTIWFIIAGGLAILLYLISVLIANMEKPLFF
ncbi:MAG: hypothetical protein Kow0090_04650 [Myxococcota bacterium]